MKIGIVTGGSKGIGKAIAKKYASEGYLVFSLSRTESKLNNVTDILVDLSDLKATRTTFISLLNTLPIEIISTITLFNNAGRLGEISTIENIAITDIAKTIQLNTTTPLILSSLFIKFTQMLTCNKQIITISSGAAIKPYQGWSIYCTSKAAIDMMTKTIALEQNENENGIKCIAIYPGVVDTNMQSTIRETKENNFKNVQRFIDLKENDELYSPSFVADKVFHIDQKQTLNNGDIIDIRDF